MELGPQTEHTPQLVPHPPSLNIADSKRGSFVLFGCQQSVSRKLKCSQGIYSVDVAVSFVPPMALELREVL